MVDKINTKHRMKLAEALLWRSDLLKKVEHLQDRIRPVLIITEGKTPQEDPAELIAKLRDTILKFEEIVVRINKTNNNTQIEGEGTLMVALARRDALKMLSEKLRNIRQSAQLNNQSSNNDLKATVDVKKLQVEIDQTGRAFREVDSKIQEVNWLTELLE